MVTERHKLTGWEQIANHLGVSVRTAQVYEREQRLPVHRLPGPKGRVWAFADELDSWNLNAGSRAPEPRETSGAPAAISMEAQPTIPKVLISRREVLLPVLGTSCILLAGAAYGLARSGIFNGRPVDWRVNGDTLTVLGESGRELWHHKFPGQMVPGFYPRISGHNRCVFSDLDGDGRWETIFIYYPLDPTRDRWKLVCFNPSGKIRWEFCTNRKVVAQSREWAPPYVPANFVIISGRSGPPRIVVASVHYWSFPCQIAVLDSAGKVVGEFWHRGHLTHTEIADLRGDGTPQAILGGVNDAPEYKQATILVFDPVAVGGASCSPAGEPYFRDFDPGTQKVEVFFPRTPVSLSQEFNRVIQIIVGDGRITASITEGISEDNPNSVVYDFDFQFNILGAFLSDPIKARYHELEALGIIEKGSVDGEGERLRKQVKILRRSV